MEDVAEADHVSDSTRVLFTYRQTVMAMLERRGYIVKRNDWDESLDDFMKVYRLSPSFAALTIHAKKNGLLCLVFFPTDKKLNVPAVRTMTDFAKERRCSHFIIVFLETITPFAKQFIANYKIENSVLVESFHISTLSTICLSMTSCHLTEY